MKEVVHPELSYKIIGIAFKIFNKIGFEMSEKYYQRAFAKELEEEKLSCEKEKFIKLYYQNQVIGSYFIDFFIENKIIVELKVKPNKTSIIIFKNNWL